MDFVKYFPVFLSISLVLIFVSLFLIFKARDNFSFEFVGGINLTAKFDDKNFDIEFIKKELEKDLGSKFFLQKMGENQVQIRSREISAEAREKIIQILKKAGKIKEDNIEFNQIEPMIGKEFQRKTILATFLSLILILIYLATSFRKTSFQVKGFKYGIAGVIALFHDTLITTGFFAFLTLTFGFQFDIPFFVALLTIIGYSINDTIVIFDRLRENLKKVAKLSREIVNKSLNEVLPRTFGTSLTTLLAILFFLFFGPKSLYPFILTLFFGVAIGTYSSIFIATPIIYFWAKK